MTQLKITEKTSISLKVVMVIAAAAVAWGITTTTVLNNGNNIAELKQEMASLNDKFDEILLDRNLTLR